MPISEAADTAWEYHPYYYAEWEREYEWELDYQYQISQGFDFDSPWPNPSELQGVFEWW